MSSLRYLWRRITRRDGRRGDRRDRSNFYPGAKRCLSVHDSASRNNHASIISNMPWAVAWGRSSAICIPRRMVGPGFVHFQSYLLLCYEFIPVSATLVGHDGPRCHCTVAKSTRAVLVRLLRLGMSVVSSLRQGSGNRAERRCIVLLSKLLRKREEREERRS